LEWAIITAQSHKSYKETCLRIQDGMYCLDLFHLLVEHSQKGTNKTILTHQPFVSVMRLTFISFSWSVQFKSNRKLHFDDSYYIKE